MPIQRDKCDDETEILKAATTDAFAFQEFEASKDFKTVRSFRKKVQSTFEQLDSDMVRLCAGDTAELTRWGARMRIVRDNLDELDRNLAFAGRRQFNWGKVIQVMGLLNALRVASEQTVELNKVIIESSD